MKFKKMKGIVLGIVLFTMSSLTVTAAADGAGTIYGCPAG